MTVRIINDVVEVTDVLFLHKIAKNIYVAIGLRIRGENVVIRDDHNFVAVPDLGLFSELAFKDPDRARSTNVVRHEDVGIDPDIIAGLHAAFAGGACENFFSECHTKEAFSPRTNRIAEYG